MNSIHLENKKHTSLLEKTIKSKAVKNKSSYPHAGTKKGWRGEIRMLPFLSQMKKKILVSPELWFFFFLAVLGNII